MHLGHIFTVVESRPEPVAILQGGSEPAKIRILRQVLKKSFRNTSSDWKND